ncbi:glycosyltransferase family 4 protein [Cerasicoccus maritimus]|uniref:glycosyltransferase family 4 protein n=1 Tax=Cerasicoccus maritimus TaxID=490089 RepID=UPI002852B641|nr:glycosyltransferase family 1 protein [Cerasicoccus maritimus]
MKILLLANYEQDNQFSMLGFAGMMKAGLEQTGHEVTMFQPRVNFGKGRNTHQGIGKWLGYYDKYIIGPRNLKRVIKNSSPDIVHICDHANAVYLPHIKGPKTIVTCHDLFAIKTWLGKIAGQSKSAIGALQQKWIFNHLIKSPSIACVSHATRDDLNTLAPETKSRTNVILSGLPYPYEPLPPEQADKIISGAELVTISGEPMPRKFILHVGNNSWYKNRIGVIEIAKKAFGSVSDIGLVLAGQPVNEELRHAMVGLEDRISILERPSNSVLQALYCKATCFLFPSLAEGFGWPPLEAQACGCPVVVSNIEPLRSNCKSALFIDPLNTSDSAQHLVGLLNDSSRLRKLSLDGLKNAERFKPKAMIDAYISLYEQAVRSHAA